MTLCGAFFFVRCRAASPPFQDVTDEYAVSSAAVELELQLLRLRPALCSELRKWSRRRASSTREVVFVVQVRSQECEAKVALPAASPPMEKDSGGDDCRN